MGSFSKLIFPPGGLNLKVIGLTQFEAEYAEKWVLDRYDDTYYNSLSSNPSCPSSGVGRVTRGGAWGGESRSVRAANRGRWSPDCRAGSAEVVTQTPALPREREVYLPRTSW